MATNNMINSPEPFALGIGGTGSALVASNGGIVYSDVDDLEILSGTATAGLPLLSGSNAAPTWGTATFPASAAINTLTYASAVNVLSQLPTVNDAALTTNATGVPTWIPLTAGQIIIGATGAAPLAGTITATGATVTVGANTIAIAVTGGGMTWSTVTAATLAAAINNAYVLNHAATPCVVTLPATAALGSKVIIRGLAGSGGWTATANTAQTIQFGNQSSSSAGSWSSVDAGDCCDLECIVANTTWGLTNALSAGLTKV